MEQHEHVERRSLTVRSQPELPLRAKRESVAPKQHELGLMSVAPITAIEDRDTLFETVTGTMWMSRGCA